MGLFDYAKFLANNVMNKYSGRKDFLEAVCAGAALVAYADGNASDDEIMAAQRAVAASPSLSKAFGASQIEQVMQMMLNRAAGGVVGRINLKREIADIRNNAEMAEIVVATLVDVASASGDIDDKEKRVIADVSRDLGIDFSKFM